MGESDPRDSDPESNTTMTYRIFCNQNLTQNVAKGTNDYESITIIRYQYNFHVRIAFKKKEMQFIKKQLVRSSNQATIRVQLLKVLNIFSKMAIKLIYH